MPLSMPLQVGPIYETRTPPVSSPQQGEEYFKKASGKCLLYKETFKYSEQATTIVPLLPKEGIQGRL